MVGVTVTEPLVPLVVNPEPEQLVALVDDQDNVADWPDDTEAELAERVTVGVGAGVLLTVFSSQFSALQPVTPLSYWICHQVYRLSACGPSTTVPNAPSA